MHHDQHLGVGLPHMRRCVGTVYLCVYTHTPAGLCKPVAQLQELHGNPNCHLPAVDAASGSIAETWHHFTFEAVPQLG